MMPASSPRKIASGHSSPWVRFVIRTLSIRGATWLILALSLCATAFVSRQAWVSERASRKARFESDSALLKDAMIERLNRYVQMLRGVRGLYAASEFVNETEFKAYVKSLNFRRNHPGIVGIGYLQWAGDELAPDDIVVRYLEPPATDRLDPGNDSAQREAAMKACDSSMPSLSPKTWVDPSRDKPMAVLYEAVYGNRSNPGDSAERRANLQGWVFLTFQTGDLLNAVIQTTDIRLGYEVYDGVWPRPEALLCRSGQSGGSKPPDPLDQQETLRLFGQPWTIRLHAPGNDIEGLSSLPVRLLSAGGLAISFLLFGIARSMATTGQRACSLAAGMTEELRHQEEALRKSEERLEMVIKGSNDGIWDWNVETDDVYFSPRWKSMLGYEDQEIENNFSSWKSLIHSEDRERALKVLDSYLADRVHSYQIELRLRHKDGSYRWILSRGVASRDADGHPVRMAGSHVDLTEIKEVEQQLRAANHELLESQNHLKSVLAELSASHVQLEKTQLELIQAAKLESVGTLAAGVAHEVKNPLQIILMGLDYLDQRLADEEENTRITLHDMRDAALRADSITKELLSFSTSAEFKPCPADIEEVIERSLWLLRTDLKRAGVTLVKQLAEDLPPVLIDRAKIQQVVINLVTNALQAMDSEGTVTITTARDQLDCVLPDRRQSHCSIAPSEEVVVLKVRDSGPGIPDELLLRVFDPFFTTKTVGSGSGLGLSVAKKIIDLHGACIHIRNSPLGGAEVILAFAIAPKTSTPPVGHVLRV